MAFSWSGNPLCRALRFWRPSSLFKCKFASFPEGRTGDTIEVFCNVAARGAEISEHWWQGCQHTWSKQPIAFTIFQLCMLCPFYTGACFSILSILDILSFWLLKTVEVLWYPLLCSQYFGLWAKNWQFLMRLWLWPLWWPFCKVR